MASLNIALSFQAKEHRTNAINSDPVVFTSWGFEDLVRDSDVDELSKKPPWGAIVGCVDGSIYIFRPDLSEPARRKPATTERRFSGSDVTHLPYLRPPHLSLSRSRNASPATSRTNLTISSSTKSRAVSGLSKEQVEAPKNFVDFEDEQQRMKGMISDRAVKNMKDRSPRPSAGLGHDLPSRRFDDANSIASVESSSTMLSPPLSPTLMPAGAGGYRKHLLMRARIIPRDFGPCKPEHSVVSLNMLEEGELLLSLQRSGKVSLFKNIDGACIVSAEPGAVPPSFRTTVMSHGTGSQALWIWSSLHIAQINESYLAIAIARADDCTVALDSGETDEKTRITIYELTDAREYQFGDTTLSKVGDVVLEGCAEGITVLHDGTGALKLYQCAQNLLSVRTLTLLPRSMATHFASNAQNGLSSSPDGHALSHSLRKLLLRNGRQSDADGIPNQASSRIDLQSGSELGKLPLTGAIKGLIIKQINEKTLGISWSMDELLAFSLRNSSIIMQSMIPLETGLQSAEWLNPDTIQLIFPDRVQTYSLPDAITNESSDSVGGKPLHTTTTLLSSVPLSGRHVISSQRGSQQPLCLLMDTDRQRITHLPKCAPRKNASREKSTPIWSASKPAVAPRSLHRITAVLPVDLGSIIVGYDDGHLSKSSLDELVFAKDVKTSTESVTIDCAILSLFVVQSARTGHRLILGGGDDGSVNVWDLETLELRVRRVLFTEPLVHTVGLGDAAPGRLHGCCLCVSGDGTIAVMTIDSLNFLYLIPGSPAILQTICLGSDNLLLFYADGRTRLWDAKTQEFRRSMSSEKAAEMLTQGSWFTTDIEDGRSGCSSALLAFLNKSTASGAPPPVSVFDIRSILDSYSRNSVANVFEQVRPDDMKALLTVLHTFSLDEHVDRLLYDFLGFTTVTGIVVVDSFDNQHCFQSLFLESSQSVWQISRETTATRLLIIVALLNAFSATKGLQERAQMLLAFYTSSLPSLVGTNYQAPSLAILAYYWNESPVGDIRSSAKYLFENEIARLPDDETSAIVEKWQHKLPCLLPEDQRQSAKAALALSICGNIAADRYTLLSSKTLSDVAKSVMIYFNDDTSPHRVLAIDLCSRGFEIWQQHFDAMEALRSLFVLATTSRKESISTKNPGPYARMAVLQIASSNSPLFVTTLSLDILHPRSVEYSKCVLQIIAFLIRKKPMVLYPNLPRLMEAVVKSLDPAQNAEREAVLDSVTDIIALVVQTFTTLDFHSASQRLAVGTSEGAVIMYDLRTATRLYVLEGHRKRLTGISFSPDGRRMVTLSVEESTLLVWKVGSSFTSFFHPGAPPRQGRSGSEPYKTLTFVLQDHAAFTIEAAMKEISFHWPSDRSVRVQIRDAVFNFST